MLIKGLLAGASLLISLSAPGATPNVTFSVTTVADRMGDRVQYSRDAAWFTTKGSAQVAIYHRETHRRVGLICCQSRTERTAEYFLKSATNADLVLQATRRRSGKGPVGLAVYNVEGKRLYSATLDPATPFNLLALDPSRKYFSLSDGSTIKVFDSSLAPVGSHRLATPVTRPMELLLSTGAKGALLIGKDAMVSAEFDSRRTASIQSCSPTGDKDFAAAASEAAVNRYIVMTGSGEGCRVDGLSGSRFKTESRVDLRGVYLTPDLVFVITATSVEALSTTTLETQSVFHLVPFYEMKFGRNEDEKPFFVQHEFDASASRLYLRGSVSTGTLFEIHVNGH